MRFAVLLCLALTLTGCTTQYTVLPVIPTVLTANPGGPYTGTAGTAVNFNGSQSSAPKGDSITYTWSFGDNTPAVTGIAPSHTFTTAGTYTVTLTVTDSSNDTASATVTAIINPIPPPKPPIANAGGPYSSTVGTAVFFDASKSSDPQGETLSYTWTFGDGAVGSGVKPGHVYWTVGVYTATVTVTNTSNLSDSASAQVTIIAAPPLPKPALAQYLYQIASSGPPPGEPNGSYATVFIYPSTESGTLTPLYTLTAATDEDVYSAEAADIYGTIYLGDIYTPVAGQAATNQILILAEPKASGTVTPARTIAGPDTGITSIGALTVDNYGNIYLLCIASGGPNPTQILEFAANAKGDAAPLRSIGLTLGQAAEISYMKIAVDAVGNVYVNTAGDGTDAVQVFSPIQSGVPTPARAITDPTIANSVGIAIDQTSNNIWVLANVALTEYAAGINGSNTEIQTFPLTTTNPTGIKSANGLAIDTEGYIYVGTHIGVNSVNNDSLYVFTPNPTAATTPTVSTFIPGGSQITVNN